MAKGRKASGDAHSSGQAQENQQPKSYASAADAGPRDHGTTPKDRLDHLKQDTPSTTQSTTGVYSNKLNQEIQPPAKASSQQNHTNGSHAPSEPKEPEKKGQHASTTQQSSDKTQSTTNQAAANANASEPKEPEKKSQHASTVQQSSEKTHSATNQAVANVNGDADLELEHSNSNGNTLTSTKSPPGYTTALDLDAQERSTRRKEQPTQDKGSEALASGRRAGAGWQESKIRWAPLNVPLQRRLQTLVVFMHGLSIIGLLAVFLLLLAIPILWPILVPYLMYCLLSRASTSGQLTHRSERLRRSSIWSLFAGYFPARLHRGAPLPPTRKYIFGYHPHGIISHGAFAAFSTEALGFSQLFPGITNTLLTLESNFRVPLYRDYALALGLASVSRESCENLLTHGGPNKEGMGRAITIVVGGARESLDSTPGNMKLVLGRRKGFVKLAMRTGADLVPVLGFGENDLYEQFDSEKHPRIHKVQMFVKRVFGFTVPLFHARGVFNYDVGLLPYRRPINIVTGNPIKVAQSSHPDNAEVDKLHGQYVAEVKRLWDEWKDEFAKHRTAELEIVE